jgi:hypothetical protein
VNELSGNTGYRNVPDSIVLHDRAVYLPIHLIHHLISANHKYINIFIMYFLTKKGYKIDKEQQVDFD